MTNPDLPPPAAGSRLPETSLIVCSRNRPAMLAETVNSILQGDTVPTELIIIDQSDVEHPTLPGLATTRPCDLRYMWKRTVGLSRANNEGIAAARFDLLVFTHDDVTVPPNWFAAIVAAAAQAGSRAAVTGQVRPSAATTPGGFAPTIKVDEAPAVYTGRLNKDVLYPLNMALYCSALAEVGGFDERLGPGTPFPGSEDADLGFRLLEAGYAIHYVPQAALYHRAWRTKRDYLPLRWGYGKARGAFYAKYLSRGERHMLRRLRLDLSRLSHWPALLTRDRHVAQGDIVLVAGILWGVLRWAATYGWSRARTPVSI